MERHNPCGSDVFAHQIRVDRIQVPLVHSARLIRNQVSHLLRRSIVKGRIIESILDGARLDERGTISWRGSS